MNISETDFELLWISSMGWGVQWLPQLHRFSSKDPIHYDHAWAYWFVSYASYLLARTFLENIGAEYQELADEASSEFMLVTNYTSVCWRKD